MTSLLERLCGLLREAKDAKGEQALSYADFMESVKKLRADLSGVHARLVMGSRLTKRDAATEAEVLKEFYTFVRGCNNQCMRELEELRTAAGAKVKMVYLPAKHPEEP
jgi:hypothetical protein